MFLYYADKYICVASKGTKETVLVNKKTSTKSTAAVYLLCILMRILMDIMHFTINPTGFSSMDNKDLRLGSKIMGKNDAIQRCYRSGGKSRKSRLNETEENIYESPPGARWLLL